LNTTFADDLIIQANYQTRLLENKRYLLKLTTLRLEIVIETHKHQKRFDESSDFAIKHLAAQNILRCFATIKGIDTAIKNAREEHVG